MQMAQVTQSVTINREMVKLIAVDDWGKRREVLEDTPRKGIHEPWVSRPEIDPNGFSVYTMPVEMAQEHLTCNIDGIGADGLPLGPRWHLYQSEPLQAKKRDPDGTSRWITYYPHYYTKYVRQVPDPENPGYMRNQVFFEFTERLQAPWDFGPIDPTADNKPAETAPLRPTPGCPPPPPEEIALDGAATGAYMPNTEEADKPEVPDMPPVGSTAQQVEKWYKDKAIAVAGEANVKAVIKRFRKDIGKKSGAFNKKQREKYITAMKAIIAGG